MSAVTKDAMSILSKKVVTMSRELQLLRPYRKVVDIDAEIATKRETFAQLHNEKMATWMPEKRCTETVAG